jgi:UrcA family protein
MKTNTIASRVGFAGLLLAALLGGAIAAQTAGADEPSQVRVHYGDLNLHSEQGARVLYNRIKAAARVACHEPPSENVALWLQFQACQSQAMNRAVRRVDQQELTALHTHLAARVSSQDHGHTYQ